MTYIKSTNNDRVFSFTPSTQNSKKGELTINEKSASETINENNNNISETSSLNSKSLQVIKKGGATNLLDLLGKIFGLYTTVIIKNGSKQEERYLVSTDKLNTFLKNTKNKRLRLYKELSPSDNTRFSYEILGSVDAITEDHFYDMKKTAQLSLLFSEDNTGIEDLSKEEVYDLYDKAESAEINLKRLVKHTAVNATNYEAVNNTYLVCQFARMQIDRHIDKKTTKSKNRVKTLTSTGKETVSFPNGEILHVDPKSEENLSRGKTPAFSENQGRFTQQL